MKFSNTFLSILTLSATVSNSFAFTVSSHGPSHLKVSPVKAVEMPYFMEETKIESSESPAPKQLKKPKKPIKKKGPAHKEGIFSPLVYGAKNVLGDAELNKLRAKFISMHSSVITDFVKTYETPFGSAVARKLFAEIDVNKDGTIDEKELALAFEKLGFTWLKEKQIGGIMKRADKDGNGVIDYEEYSMELPRTLKTNLIKLAKKNGDEMGFLV